MPALARKIDFGHGNQRAELPLLEPTLGPPMIDTRRLREETGCWAYDPSFGATGACRSAITYVDGDEGILLYRGSGRAPQPHADEDDDIRVTPRRGSLGRVASASR